MKSMKSLPAFVPTKPLISNPALLVVLIFVCSIDLCAATQPLSRIPDQVKAMMNTQMPLIAPLFIENGEFTSELFLVNSSTVKTYADVFVRDVRGELAASKRVILSPNSQQRLAIRSLLQNAGSSITTGTIFVTPSPDLMGMSIAAQLTMTFRKYNQPSYIDEELAMPSMEGSNELHAVADAGEGYPILSIVNLSKDPQQVAMSCIRENGEILNRIFEVSASATTVLRSCAESTNSEVSQDQIEIADSKHASHGALGISINSNGEPGSLAAFAINPHREKDSLVFTSVSFSDPKMIHSSGVVFPGVPVGPVPLLALEGSFTPVLSIANFGSKATNVNLKFATTSNLGEAATLTTLRTLRMTGHSSATVNLKGLNSSLVAPLGNSLVIESDEVPGQIGVKLVSLNESTRLRVEQLDKDEGHLENAGLHPWSLEQGAESTLLLFNPYSLSNKFDVRISSDTTTWDTTYTLGPFETLVLSLRDLQLNQTEDDHQHTLSRTVMSGQVDWSNTTGPRGTGRLLLSNREIQLARSFSCSSYYNLCFVGIIPDSTEIINNGSSISFNDNLRYCWAYNPFACYGNSGGGGSILTQSWNAGGGAGLGIVLSGAADCAGNYTCSINGTASGYGYVTATVSDYNGCTLTSPPTRVDVNPPIPVNFSQTAVDDNGNGTLTFTYNWESSDSSLPDLSNCSIREWVNYPTTGFYFWASPPYIDNSSGTPQPPVTPSPTILPSPPLPASNGVIYDNQFRFDFLPPYGTDDFTAHQFWQFSCSNVQNGDWINLTGDIPINRHVSNIPPWTYTVEKSGSSASLVLP